MKKRLFLDIETTGLEPAEGAVICSIGAVVSNGTEPEDYLSLFIKPTQEQWSKASPKALEINGLTYDFLHDAGKSFNDARDDFLNFLVELGLTSDVAYIGQNPAFDVKFLSHYFGPELDFVGRPWAEEAVNVMELYSAASRRKLVPFLKSRSGKNISLALGVEPEPDVHDALEGAKVVQRNYNALVKLLGDHKSGIVRL